MRILLVHADHFEYEVNKEAIDEPEKISPDQKKGSEEEVLVVFSTAEKTDREDVELVIEKTADVVEETGRSVHTKNILIYPYAHLSSDLADPKLALDVLRKVTNELEKRGLNVKRSPFGWYKSFKMNAKGHPLSELSRTITPSKHRKLS
ncbi:MAG: threonyl-tRNA synthetase editing domain-containing protein, partial [Candidatus Bathyarchaeia archaeon]